MPAMGVLFAGRFDRLRTGMARSYECPAHRKISTALSLISERAF
jgi:hypothetical protein